MRDWIRLWYENSFGHELVEHGRETGDGRWLMRSVAHDIAVFPEGIVLTRTVKIRVHRVGLVKSRNHHERVFVTKRYFDEVEG